MTAPVLPAEAPATAPAPPAPTGTPDPSPAFPEAPAGRSSGRIRAAASRHFGGLPGPFWVVFSGTVINRIGTMVLPFLVFYLGSRGLSDGQIPYVLGALGAGGLAGPILGGWFADRFGRRPAILTGMIATPATQGLLFLSPGLVTLTMAAALVGAASALHAPGVGAVIADSAPVQRRQAAFGLYHWAINIGAATAGALGGFLIVHGFWVLFLLDAVTCLGFAAVAAFLLPHDEPHTKPRDRRQGKGAAGGSPQPATAGYGVVLHDRLMLLFAAVCVAGECVYAQTEFSIPMAIRDDGLPAGVYGLVAVVNALVVVLLQPFTNAWLLRFDRMRVWGVASVLVAVGVALTGVAGATSGYVLTTVVWSAGEVCAAGIATSVVADLAPADARARYQGVLNWSRGVARFLALAAAPALYAAAGPATLWWTVAGFGLCGAAGALLLRPALLRRTAAEPVVR
ncbi:MFS transporter [Streptomyces sp. CA-111067]|uniref:MFS transporter n=1 Tax=Streptomyces sp. CA-111067 TaxID=3240046 RepID=UPI003D981E5A